MMIKRNKKMKQQQQQHNAGEKKQILGICGDNKLFLLFDGHSLFFRYLEAMGSSSQNTLIENEFRMSRIDAVFFFVMQEIKLYFLFISFHFISLLVIAMGESFSGHSKKER